MIQKINKILGNIDSHAEAAPYYFIVLLILLNVIITKQIGTIKQNTL